jgi:hypothetical protein
MVDFRRGPRQWYSELVDSLRNLDVVQIAHHAGNNGLFYHALLAAGERSERKDELLLLSHASRDLHRPSAEFRDFLEQRVIQRRPRLLFTSVPSLDKIDRYRPLIDPPVGPVGDVGDVCVAFVENAWNVRSHAIAV